MNTNNHVSLGTIEVETISPLRYRIKFQSSVPSLPSIEEEVDLTNFPEDFLALDIDRASFIKQGFVEYLYEANESAFFESLNELPKN